MAQRFDVTSEASGGGLDVKSLTPVPEGYSDGDIHGIYQALVGHTHIFAAQLAAKLYGQQPAGILDRFVASIKHGPHGLVLEEEIKNALQDPESKKVAEAYVEKIADDLQKILGSLPNYQGTELDKILVELPKTWEKVKSELQGIEVSLEELCDLVATANGAGENLKAGIAQALAICANYRDTAENALFALEQLTTGKEKTDGMYG